MELIYPMFSMVVLTVVIGVTMLYVRIRSVYSGELNPRYFKLLSGYEVPEKAAKLGRNWINLFEVPILFYAVATLAIALNIDSELSLTCGWLFFFFRLVHSIIHITYNNPFHRLVPFILSFICVLIIWVDVLIIISNSM